MVDNLFSIAEMNSIDSFAPISCIMGSAENVEGHTVGTFLI